MDKMNVQNMIKSFFLGLFIGVVLQFIDQGEALFSYRLLVVLASGSIGFLIGLMTEWLTSKLPIRMANAKTYFFVNNLIALVITALLMSAVILITNRNLENRGGFVSIILIVLGIVCTANLLDYGWYRRAQHKLKTFQASLKDK